MARQNLIAGLGWSLLISAFFLEFGSMSLVGVTLWVVMAVVPPLVFAALSGEPPATIAEVLYNAEKNR